MKLFWTQPARQDRDEIRNYIGLDNLVAARALNKLFDEKASLLEKFPLLGRVGSASNTRELVVHRHYILIYRVKQEQIDILRVMHTKKNRR